MLINLFKNHTGECIQSASLETIYFHCDKWNFGSFGKYVYSFPYWITPSYPCSLSVNLVTIFVKGTVVSIRSNTSNRIRRLADQPIAKSLPTQDNIKEGESKAHLIPIQSRDFCIWVADSATTVIAKFNYFYKRWFSYFSTNFAKGDRQSGHFLQPYLSRQRISQMILRKQ
jgi:hypothetical protein